MILAGGRGVRVGGEVAKQFLPLGDRTVLEHSVAAFARHPAIDRVLVVAPADALERVRELLADPAVLVTAGGAERHESTRCAVSALRAAGASDDDAVLVHDAARPFVPARVIDEAVESLASHDVVATLVPSSDTMVRIDPETGRIVEALVREELRRHQTPQGFRLGVLDDAHGRAAAGQVAVPAVTDDCTLVCAAHPGVVVGVVEGAPEAFKITDALDLRLARAVLAEQDAAPHD